MKTRIKIAQRILAAAGLYDGKIDGLLGPKTMAGLRAFPDMPAHFSKARMVVASIQLGVKKAGFSPGPIDGYRGPSTEEAVAVAVLFRTWQKGLDLAARGSVSLKSQSMASRL